MNSLVEKSGLLLFNPIKNKPAVSGLFFYYWEINQNHFQNFKN